MVKVAFVHPDLGIGGAERLVVDAGLALTSRQHKVHFYTAHHDRGHAFAETVNGELPVTVYGDWLPQHFGGRGKIICSILRSFWTALRLVLNGEQYDVIICDQISASIPILRWKGAKILFYCHYPDLLLTKRQSLLKRLYRAPVDLFEELTTGMADRILVNSEFTKRVFTETFQRIRVSPEVLYPTVRDQSSSLNTLDVKVSHWFSDSNEQEEDKNELSEPVLFSPSLPDPSSDSNSSPQLIVSINRFERKKDLPLALKAMQIVAEQFPRAKLVLAGGYDPINRENKEHYEELHEYAANFNLSTSEFPSFAGQVVFLRSFTDVQRAFLFKHCRCVVYTPSGEHFGIVPVEAMYAARAVVAVNNGGPTESVVDGKTGFLRDNKPELFAEAIIDILRHPEISRDMGMNGKRHAMAKFSFERFTIQLDKHVADLAASKRKSRRTWFLFVAMCSLCLFGILALFS